MDKKPPLTLPFSFITRGQWGVLGGTAIQVGVLGGLPGD